MNWISLTDPAQLPEIVKQSASRPQVIFKHSTRCPISRMIKSRLEKSDAPEDIDFYYLDLLKYRSLSNQIANEFGVRHESPQIILLKDGESSYDEDHSAIYMDDIVEHVGRQP